MKFIGASRDIAIAGLDIQQARSNYFKGNDPSRWRTGVPNYARVRYREIYPGVDLIFYRSAGELEYDFVLQPGADPQSIRFELSGSGEIRFDSHGDLLFGGARVRRPSVYQEIDGRRKWIAAEFRRLDSHQVAFQVAPWDRRRTLVIDPVLTYSTHLGGGSPGDKTGVYGIVADAAGNAYVTGFTAAQDFPTRNAEQPFYGGDNGDAFIAKISADGSTLLYATYLGGSNTDQGNAIAIDAAGNAYVTGVTESSNFPTVVPFQTFQHSPKGSGGAAFVAKISADGSKLLYSSWLGGSGAENASAIAVDTMGSAYVTGVTYSSDFPTKNAFQPGGHTGNGSGDAFVTKLQPNGSGLVYSTYLGGSALDQGMGIAVDAGGSAYITGYTQSPDFPVENAYRSTPPGTSDPFSGYPPTAFVTKLSADGKSLVYSTFLGGSVEDGGVAIAVDAAGSAYVLGRTASANFPVQNAFQQATSVTHAFVTKFSPNGSTLAYSTRLGGTMGAELAWSNGDLIYNSPGGITVDAGGHASIAGGTSSSDFPVTSNALQPQMGAGAFSNAFFSELSADGSSLVYSTFLGGSSLASAYSLALDPSGNAYLAGRAGTGFQTVNPLPGGLSGGGFVTKIGAGVSSTAAPQVSGALNVDGAKTIAPASWVAIYGTNLSTTTIDWTGQISSAGALPTQLAGTTVTINGKSAYVYSVSPTQINVIAPDDGTVGIVPIVVTVNGTASVAANVALNPVSPALFLWSQNYVVATHLDYSPAVKNGVLSGETTQTAAPGEVIILWGTGLGPVTPPAPAGIVTQAAGFVQTPVTVFFGTVAQTAMAAALTPGDAALYQIAVTVPSTLAPGDYSIGLAVDGSVGSTGLLTVAGH